MRKTILQWNIQGIKNKKKELIQLINDYNADIIAIQETQLSNDYIPKIDGFTSLNREGTFNFRHHGGVTLYIHQDIPMTEVKLNTPIQAVATTVTLNRTITICNMYSSRSHTLLINNLQELYNQLPKPCIILGDINAYSPRWGSSSSDARGRTVERLIDDNNLIVMNNGAPTHHNYNSDDTAIDIALCSPTIAPEFEWNTAPTVLDSDHYPITITTEAYIPNQTPIRNYNKADWTIFKNSMSWENLPHHFSNNQAMLEDFYQRINVACDEAIPTYTPSKFLPKPWWTPDLTASRNKRERFYQIYRRNRSQANLIKWRRARAIHKNNVSKAKEESWREYISEFDCEIPISTLCKRIKRLKGIPPQTTRILQDDTQRTKSYKTPAEISEILAQTFAQVSSNDNYAPEFIPLKEAKEQNMPDFGVMNTHYNLLFTMSELDTVLRKTKNTAPGADGITYQMIRALPINAKEHLLRMLNKFFQEAFFPQDWSHSIIIPIAKPGKNPNSPSSYRPIALTSCLCKIMERLINARLLEYLLINRGLSPAQCGCQRNRSTTDHLVRLEDSIRCAFSHHQHYISIFFDLERAYDMTWRKGIVIDLYKLGLRGLLPRYIAAFLESRYFRVKIGNTLSNQYEQKNGVPQGAVLSVLLFAIKINGVVQNLPTNPSFTFSLYVDDLQIGCRDHDLRLLGITLQQALNTLHRWTLENGFKFSITKTKAVHFSKLNGLHNIPPLKLGNVEISYVPVAKFLGLWFDTKLTWKHHLTLLKNSCQKLLGIMRMISGQTFGATQDCLMKIYRIYVRSKLDYGAIVYASATDTNLKTLDVVANDALRIATGAFKSTPLEPLYVIAEEASPIERRKYLTMRYFLKLKSSIANPANRCTTPRNENLYNARTGTNFALRVRDIKNEFNLPQFCIQPEFSYLTQNCTTPFYAQSKPAVNKDLAKHPKSSTPPVVYRNEYAALKSDKYQGFNMLYTDGSKSDRGVGAAAVTRTSASASSLSTEASIYTAELYALRIALNSIERTNYPNNVIFTDSKSAIDSLHNQNYHPYVRLIIFKLTQLQLKNIYVEFCWIPSHIEITGNEKADQKAKDVSSRPPEHIPIYFKDYFPVVKNKFEVRRNEVWSQSRSKLKEIRETTTAWIRPPDIKRHDEVLLNRIRLGHTNITHKYLMESQPPPGCPYCDGATLSVRHIFIECSTLQTIRRQHLGPSVATLTDAIGSSANVPALMRFLKEIYLYDKI